MAISVNDIDKYIGCNSEFSGILSAYNHIDNYIVGVDTLFCSDACPCYLNNRTGFEKDHGIYSTYEHWNITLNDKDPVDYQQCSEPTHAFLYNSYSARYNGTLLDEKQFWNYYNYIESQYDCVGFCRTQYYSDFSKTNQTMYKYMFTDVNRGVPKNVGCMKTIITTIQTDLKWIALVAIILTALLLILFLLGVSLCCANRADKNSIKM
jgi:hypothetical protein